MFFIDVTSGKPNKFKLQSIILKTHNTLFSLGNLTYTYERQDIIQIALKRLPGGGGVP
jgi:hypothetical protein